MNGGLLFLADQQAVVTAIGLPEDVKDVARHGDCSQRGFQKDVGNHADESDGLHAAPPGGKNDDEGSDARGGVADARYPANDGVEPKTNAGAGDAEHVVQKGGDVIEVFIGGELARHSALTLYGPALAKFAVSLLNAKTDSHFPKTRCPVSSAEAGASVFRVDMPQEFGDTPVGTPQEEAWARKNRKSCRAHWI